MKRTNINKVQFFSIIAILILLVGSVFVFGSKTLERRKNLQSLGNEIIDTKTGEVSHITGDLLEHKKAIVEGNMPYSYMSEAQQASVVDLYNYANEKQILNTDRRSQQLAYHSFLIVNQKNIPLILFGNGYLTNHVELTLEMETIAILFNFGIIGFILYIAPFLSVFLYGVYYGLKNFSKLDTEFLMLLAGCFLSLVLSTLSGYTFFNSSSMMIIITLNILLLNKIHNLKDII